MLLSLVTVARVLLLAFLSFIALIGIVTAGSVLHVARQRAATVTCTPLSGGTGTLMLFSLPGAPSVLPSGGVPLVTMGPTNGLANLVVDDNDQRRSFVFQTCKSNFIGASHLVVDHYNIYFG
jgi:hypothetical protein